MGERKDQGKEVASKVFSGLIYAMRIFSSFVLASIASMFILGYLLVKFVALIFKYSRSNPESSYNSTAGDSFTLNVAKKVRIIVEMYGEALSKGSFDLSSILQKFKA